MRTVEPHPLEPDRHHDLHPELDHWRSNVGEPVALDGGIAPADRLTGIDVICWNVAIGLGRLDHVIDRVRSGAFTASLPDRAAAPAGTAADRPLVILLQEAFRAGGSVPATAASAHHGGRPGARGRTDIVDFAERHGFSLRYSPSMRNGRHASDRGNAILSTVRLADARALLLPYVRQRRVVVTASIDGHPWLRFASAHLDTHGRSGALSAGGPFGGGRAAQARALGSMLADAGAVVLGADLNSVLGMSDAAVRELVTAGLHPARRVGGWRHTYHARIRLLLDHVMFRTDDHRIRHVDVVRIDEAAGDRSRAVFGSDHHPLLAAVELGEPAT